ncbi:MAG: sigma-70 family RNA polymerase sigma factor [Actinobacteria bacterium]|nr:sigma-70 family RNA polymerase sigma factor [Actinomycetota bacterium]
MARQARIGAAFDTVLAAGQAGAPWAFDRLWRAYAPAVVSYLSLQGIFDPEDLVSEVFLGTFRGIGRFRGNEDQFRGWLFTIAHRRVTDERRRAAVRPQLAGSIADLPDMAVPDRRGGDVEEDALRRLDEDRVRALCEALQPGQRDVLLLRLIADLTVDQVAEALGKTPGAVKALQRRGLGALRTTLQEEGVPL